MRMSVEVKSRWAKKARVTTPSFSLISGTMDHKDKRREVSVEVTIKWRARRGGRRVPDRSLWR